jgi:hypothetical protein
MLRPRQLTWRLHACIQLLPVHEWLTAACAGFEQVLAHMSTRLAWADERFQLRVFTTQQLANPSVRAAFTAALEDCPIFLGVGLQEAADVQAVEGAVKAAKVPTTLYFDSAPQLQQLTQVDGYAPARWAIVQAMLRVVGG